jgi:hypothetical protein
MCQFYHLLKDFAGPVATIIAAMVAVFVTWRLGSGQQSIAEQQAITARQQANTALDQLRYNLFQKRYSIYKCGIDLIRLLENGIQNPTDIVPFLETLDEARFFFADEVCQLLDALKKSSEQLAMAYGELHRLKESEHSRRVSLAKAIAEQTTLLKNVRLRMPALFENALQFPQLTGRGELRP